MTIAFKLPKPRPLKTEVMFVRISAANKLRFYKICKRKHVEPTDVLREFINQFVEKR